MGNVSQTVVVNVQREKKKKTPRKKRSSKTALRGNNPAAFGSASSTNTFPTHRLQTYAPLLMPARTLDDMYASGHGTQNLLGYQPRPEMPQLGPNASNENVMRRMQQLETNVGAGAQMINNRLDSLHQRLGNLNVRGMPGRPVGSRNVRTAGGAAAAAAPAPAPDADAPRRGRGRPPGSRNRPREAPQAPLNENEAQAPL